MKLLVHNLLVNTFLIILVLNPINGKTQNIDYNLYSAKKLIKFAQTAEQRGDYYTAIDCYEVYLAKKGKDYEAWYRLAENYRNARDYVKAEGAYKEVIDNMQNPPREAFFYYAEMVMQQGQYKEALDAFNLANKKRQQGVERYLTKNRITACEMILNGSVETKKIRLVHLNNSVNKVNTELSPMFLDNNTLLYSSIKADTIEFTETSDAAATINVARFYTAKRDGDTIFQDNGPWNNFNNDNYFTGNGALSADKKRFYFTYCHRSALNKAICELYVSENKNGRWSEPKRLNDGINARGYTSTQVTVGYDSKYKREVIYFVSDRPGTRGGMDLWYS
ncbi:MAG: tetratricopeptide repeat protein, partial [Bacteroidales bacterium]|nr:tetratricopeptide repeat protein [Bacteroidales bacterium]